MSAVTTTRTTELLTRRSPIGWILAGLILVVVVSAAYWLLHPMDEYTRSVLSLSGNEVRGRSIFVMNCVDCHGQWADGKVGPSLRNVSERLSPARIVTQVVSGKTPPMPQFQPEPQEMADLLSYLKQL
ncbi:MAG: cytochrome c [Oscillatoriales cyanobacterium SM2_2_1]|nr:cytochrome c [Oscillatoriales cyanobacterium SM2_2_1]